ncbi:MAG: glycosyltransferase [Flavobacteriaceae bacterium]|nr:glycosyltransferase [Flavobacteriaceae bacterium]
MNILQLRGEFSDNGPGTQTVTISTELRKRGHKVILCSSGGYLTEKINALNFKYYIVPEIAFKKRNVKNMIISIFKVRKILIKEDINIVHTHNAASVFIANVAALLAFKKVKFFQSVRGIENRKGKGWRNWIYNIANYNAMFAVSKFTKGKIMEFGVKSDKIVVTYNGVDLNRFDINKKDTYRLEVRKELDIPEDAFVIGIIGRQDGNKGHRDLVQAFELLYKEFPNLYIVLVGEGKQMEDNIKLAKELSVYDRCRFTGLRLDAERLHASFNVFTILSKKNYEMFPNVIIEAMSYRNTFVGTNTTGVPEAAERGEGFICEPHDLECISGKFRKLILDEDLRTKMGNRARQSVEEQFNINNVVNIIEESYNKK